MIQTATNQTTTDSQANQSGRRAALKTAGGCTTAQHLHHTPLLQLQPAARTVFKKYFHRDKRRSLRSLPVCGMSTLNCEWTSDSETQNLRVQMEKGENTASFNHTERKLDFSRVSVFEAFRPGVTRISHLLHKYMGKWCDASFFYWKNSLKSL